MIVKNMAQIRKSYTTGSSLPDDRQYIFQSIHPDLLLIRKVISYAVMIDQMRPDEIHTPRISDLLTDEQESQLTLILAELITYKWASLTIEIVNGKIRFYRPQPSIEAYPAKIH